MKLKFLTPFSIFYSPDWWLFIINLPNQFTWQDTKNLYITLYLLYTGMYYARNALTSVKTAVYVKNLAINLPIQRSVHKRTPSRR